MHLSVRTCALQLILSQALLAQVRLTVADAVSQALADNPQLVTAAARVGVAEGLQRQAGLTPNPRLILQSENTRFSGFPAFKYPRDADTYAFVAQVLETGGKRIRRVELATENTRRSELEAELSRRQIVSRVSIAYWAAAGDERIRDLLQDEVRSFDRVVQFHRDRVREGAAAEVDLLRIEVERDRLVSSARTAELDSERATIALFREMGKGAFPTVEFADTLEQARTVAVVPLDQVLEQRVEIKLARASVDQAQANLRLQQANAKTDPDLHVGYKRTLGFDTLYAAVQFPLPIRNRNQGQIEAAIAETRAAESSIAATEAAIRAELESAKRAYESRQKALNDTLRPMRDRAGEVYQIVDAAYRETGSDILRLLDAERTKIETDLLYIRSLSEFQQSAVVLETAQGSLP
ncbi:MAG: outer membrane protein [Bryobacterales bacterium]|nr:outer membrane protein [Bryobacterales bacterium]